MCEPAFRSIVSQLAMAAGLAWLPHLAHAQPAAEIPWMTGTKLVKKLGNVDPRTVDWAPDSPFASRAIAAEFHDMLNGEFAQGYIFALRDSTEGKLWCWAPSQPKPHTLIEDVTHHLRKLSDEDLKRNASDLIIEHWRTTFPCPARRNK